MAEACLHVCINPTLLPVFFFSAGTLVCTLKDVLISFTGSDSIPPLAKLILQQVNCRGGNNGRTLDIFRANPCFVRAISSMHRQFV